MLEHVSAFAAALVVLLHLAFIAFAVLGATLLRHWPRVAWAHLPAVAWAAWVELSGRPAAVRRGLRRPLPAAADLPRAADAQDPARARPRRRAAQCRALRAVARAALEAIAAPRPHSPVIGT